MDESNWLGCVLTLGWMALVWVIWNLHDRRKNKDGNGKEG